MRNTLAVRPNREGGFALVELFMGATVLIVGSLALMTLLLTSARVSEDARVRTLARDEAVTVIEDFRNICRNGFAAAVTEYAGREVACQRIAVGKDSAKVQTEIVLDESAVSPPMDLNGDGDTIDNSLTANELAVVCMTARITWQSGKQVERFATIIARADVAGDGDQLPGSAVSEDTPPGITLTSSNVSTDSLTAKLMTAEQLNVAGMTIYSSVPAYVKQIRVNGKDVFKQTTNLPPTGQLIVTSPFTMPPGSQSIDTIAFAGSPSGGKTDVSKATLSIVFLTEGGDRLVVIN
ncbi:MAG TPA: hypothetical protein VF384_07220 [Planctomycetota bacterium]